MDVAPPFGRDQRLDAQPGLVVVAPVFDDLGAIRTHGGVLVRVVSYGNEDAALHAVHAARKRNRLAVIAGAGADDAAAPLLGRQLREKVQSAADLERAGWIVVLVLDPRLAAKPLVQQRMPQQR